MDEMERAMGMVIAASALLIAVACATDIRDQRIPNWLTAGFFGLGMLYHGMSAGLHGLLAAGGGAAAGLLPLLLVYLFKGIGAGDVKLFGAAGAWMGAASILQLMMYAMLFAGAIGLLLILLRRPFLRAIARKIALRLLPAAWLPRLGWASEGKSFPFMLAVAPAAVTMLIAMF